MTQVIIQDVAPRTQLIATSGQTVFNTNWTADQASDVLVYARANGVPADDATQLVSSLDYTVSFVGVERTVRITFAVGRTLNDIITIVRDTPATRQNLYVNGNFVPSMLNQDFGLLTLIDQQNEMYDKQINPRYNVSAEIEPYDLVLPQLGANQIWAMNPDNDEIVAYNVPSGGGLAPDDGQYLVQTADVDLPDAVALDAQPSGFMVNQNGTGLAAFRTITGTANQIDVSNGNGVAGNPTLSIADNPVLLGTAGMGIPRGTTAQRVIPTPPSIGLRFNTDINSLEAYISGMWQLIPSSGTDSFLPLSGGTMAGVINMNNNAIENLPAPVNNGDAVNKAYADTIASGFVFLNPVRGASTANYVCTYNNGTSGVGATLTANSNGAFTADGLTGVAGQRFLLKDQSSTLENGIYVLTTVGDGSNPFVLTRATDFDTSSEISINELVSVAEGTTQAGDLYRVTVNQPVIGTDPITFSIFLDASNIVTLNGNQTITGTKTFTANNDYGTPSAINLTNGTNLPITSGTTGTLGITRGGTGLTATPTAGQLPIGNGAGYTLGTLTAGSNITITSGVGSIIIAALGGGLQTIQIFTSSGTWTKPAGITKILVKAIGGGGGGGGVGGAANRVALGGGGASGGYGELFLDVTSIASRTVTIGAAGAGGVAGNNNGSAGGTTSFGTDLTCTGGAGGINVFGTGVTLTTQTNTPGSSTGGYLNVNGSSAQESFSGTASGCGGYGGFSQFGQGGIGGKINNASANVAGASPQTGAFGAGGGGSISINNAANTAGADGAPGLVIVYEFS